MRKLGMALVMVFALMCVIAPMTAMAAGDHGVHKKIEKEEQYFGNDAGSRSYLGAALAIGLAIAAFGGALGQGRAISSAVESMARQPEAAGKIQTAMIIGLALIETLVIYMLLICFVFSGKL